MECPSPRLTSVDRHIPRAPAAFPTRKQRLGPTRALRRSSGQEARTREKRCQSRRRRRQSGLFSQTGSSLENSNRGTCERRSHYRGVLGNFHDACRLRGSVEPHTFMHSLPPPRHSGKKNPVPSIPQIPKCFFEGQGVISFKLEKGELQV